MKDSNDFSKGERGKFYFHDATFTFPVYLEPDVDEFVTEKKTNTNILSSLKVDRTVFTVTPLTDVSDEKAYWLSRTPYERLRHIELLRRINYGHRATARLQRVLEFAQR